MKLNKCMSKSVKKRIYALIENDSVYGFSVYIRFNRLRKYKLDKWYSDMRMFNPIIGCVKCY